MKIVEKAIANLEKENDMKLLDLLGTRMVYFDGGMGTLLQEQGLSPGELPEIWNITHANIVTQIHKDYLNAGCDIISTNTFGANGLKFPGETGYSLNEIVTSAIKNVKTAIKEACPHRSVYTALDLGPTGKLLKPLGDLDFEDAYSLYREVIQYGEKAGADLILIETMSDTYETKAAILAAKENSSLPVFATMIFDEKGKLLTGGNAAAAVTLLEGLGVDALGINCGLGPAQMKDILKDILEYASIPIIVNPNAGLPHVEEGKTIFNIKPEEFASIMKEIAEMGACILGGCCGTTPEHLRHVIAHTKNIVPRPLSIKEKTMVSSYSHAVEIAMDPVIIGERINPTGKAKLKQALRERNLDYILKEGLNQQENGAHILDVNVGLPGIDEKEMMEKVIIELQSILSLPLQIDTANPDAMERALRIYNGKALINSVNGKEEVMNAIFPLVKKYGGVVVGLALDENGIPDTAEGRLKIAEKIYQRAADYGIAKKDIIIDALAMTISSDTSSAQTTLDTLKLVKERLGGKTILGVSNISFGLPQREQINSIFYSLAMENGLNAAIINPGSEAMKKSYFAFRALKGLDSQCMHYINQYSGQNTAISAPSKQEIQEMSLKECIKKGLRDQAFEATKGLVEKHLPLSIINEELIPALDFVGKQFEKGTLFLPQLLMSAEAAKASFEVIQDHMAKTGQVQQKKGKIVLATVKGDIHDIGKNIVKALLENYSYEVIDLGKDVDPQLIVDTVLEKEVPLVGLSALMTTTVTSMETTIRLLRKAAPKCHIMVGGAVLTPEYANQIHASQYVKDAMASVYYAAEVFQELENGCE